MSRGKKGQVLVKYSDLCVLDVDGLHPYEAQQKCNGKMWTAIRAGMMPDNRFKGYCVDCGRIANIHDHRDWRLPLSVELVCHSCNLKRGAAAPFENRPRRYDGRLVPRKPNKHPMRGFLQLIAEATTEPFE